MIRKKSLFPPALAALVLLTVAAGPAVAMAQEVPGSITGTVVLPNGEPVHAARILISGLGRSTTTDEFGRYEIADVPPGSYQVVAQREHLAAERQTVTVVAGQVTEAIFLLGLAPIHEHITVTAAPVGAATTFDAFNAVTVLDAFDLTRTVAPTLGEVLENEAGIDRRDFGPGSSRPIIRGFDGDRVLIMQDGIRTGDLSSQSADHGVSIDPGSLESLEVVRGPATLLYGSNAVGGVVNAITPHDAFRGVPPAGLKAQLTTDGGTANTQAGVNGSVQFTEGRWTFWGAGGARRTGDYDTPEGPIENSAVRSASGRGGLGYSGEQMFASLGYQTEGGRYGVPFAGEFHDDDDDHDDDEEVFIDLDHRRHALRFDFGFRNLANRYAETARVVVNYLDWRHDEIEIEDGDEEIGTSFRNQAVVWRADVHQRRVGRLSGRVGLSGLLRDYEAVGEEALAPPTTQNELAAFAYQEMDFGSYRLQFGGRIERNAYRPGDRPEGNLDAGHDDHDHGVPEPRDRTFAGASGSVGVHVDLTPDSAFVLNLTRAFRSPALEELYNFGPHVGNLAFEIGNPDLEREGTWGIDLSLRHRAGRARGQFNVYHYRIDNFVFPELTGEVEHGLREVEFVQGDSRFTGFDAKAGLELHRNLWLNVTGGYTRAHLLDPDTPLPRIPPFHGRVTLEVPVGDFTVAPQLVLAARQSRVYADETPTDGYAVLNLQGTWVRATAHAAHIVSVRGTNLTNGTYRRHTSFIKDFAPEMGRSLRFSYSVRFF